MCCAVPLVVEITAQPSLVSMVRVFIIDLAAQMGFSSDECADIEFAVGEACDNSVRANAQSSEDGRVVLEITPGKDVLHVAVLDHGADFRAQFERHIQIEADIRALRCSGYGLQIIRKLMDRVEYERQDGRNRLTMTKFHVRPGPLPV